MRIGKRITKCGIQNYCFVVLFFFFFFFFFVFLFFFCLFVFVFYSLPTEAVFQSVQSSIQSKYFLTYYH